MSGLTQSFRPTTELEKEIEGILHEGDLQEKQVKKKEDDDLGVNGPSNTALL